MSRARASAEDYAAYLARPGGGPARPARSNLHQLFATFVSIRSANRCCGLDDRYPHVTAADLRASSKKRAIERSSFVVPLRLLDTFRLPGRALHSHCPG